MDAKKDQSLHFSENHDIKFVVFNGQLLKSFSQCLMGFNPVIGSEINIINTGIRSVYHTVYCSAAQRPTSAWRSAFTARVTRSAPTETLLSTSTRCWRSNSEVSEENQTMCNCSNNQHGFAFTLLAQ